MFALGVPETDLRRASALRGRVLRSQDDAPVSPRDSRKTSQQCARGFTEKWSNGPVEGFIHKLKLIKRSMYGRASFGLLRRRVLGAS